jgi:hypothetical protein
MQKMMPMRPSRRRSRLLRLLGTAVAFIITWTSSMRLRLIWLRQTMLSVIYQNLISFTLTATWKGWRHNSLISFQSARCLMEHSKVKEPELAGN